MKLAISSKAAADILLATRWWLTNRPSAPLLLERELTQALEFITATPYAGVRLRNTRRPGVHLVMFRRTRYLLYYYVVPAKQEVYVLRLWHGARGQRPPRF